MDRIATLDTAGVVTSVAPAIPSAPAAPAAATHPNGTPGGVPQPTTARVGDLIDAQVDGPAVATVRVELTGLDGLRALIARLPGAGR